MADKKEEMRISQKRYNLLKMILDVYIKIFNKHQWLVTNNDIVECVDGSAEFGYLEGILQVLEVVPPEQGLVILDKLERRAESIRKKEQ